MKLAYCSVLVLLVQTLGADYNSDISDQVYLLLSH